MKIFLRNYVFRADSIFFAFLIVLITLPFLAPLFMYWDWHFLSRPIYFVYSFFCHQYHHRSFHIHDGQCAWCARDSGIWIGVAISTFLYKIGFLRKIKWYMFPLFLLPMLLDGGIQTFFTLQEMNPDGSISELSYVSNNFTRFLTGAIAGVGMGLFLVPGFIDTSDYYSTKINTFLNNSILKKQLMRYFGVFLSFILIYVCIIFIWNMTSTEYKPNNLLDSVRRDSEMNMSERRKNGECPTNDEDIFQFGCLTNWQSH